AVGGLHGLGRAGGTVSQQVVDHQADNHQGGHPQAGGQQAGDQPTGGEEMTMAKALNTALADALRSDERVVLIGEDIGTLGGAFRSTDGMHADFGRQRVIDSPLAESGILGTSVGMAYRGLRPVAEIQFDGFIYPAFDQIVAQVAKLHYRTDGNVRMPIKIRVPYGGGIGAVEHHSESPESYFAHTAG